MDPVEPASRYDAFISYDHDDAATAAEVHDGLRRLATSRLARSP